MEDKNKKILQVAFWGVVLIIVIMVSIIFRSLQYESIKNSNEITVETEETNTSETIVYDGSENNPYIPGVQ